MHLFSETEYDSKLYKELCLFKDKFCVAENISYKHWTIYTLSAVHNTKHQRKKILLIQGRAELTDKYLPLIYELFKEGFDVYTFDHLGQGFSSRVGSPTFTHIEKFSDYTESTLKVIEHYKLHDAFVIANSMGGAIYLKLTEHNSFLPQKAVLIAPMLVIKKLSNPLKIIFSFACDILEFLQRLFKISPLAFFGQNKYQKPTFEKNNKTHSKQRLDFYHDIYSRNPNIAIGGVSFSWVNQILKNPINKIAHIPTIFFIAENDRIIDSKAGLKKIEQWQKNYNKIEIYTVKNAYHDILNESDDIRNPVIQLIMEYFTNE